MRYLNRPGKADVLGVCGGIAQGARVLPYFKGRCGDSLLQFRSRLIVEVVVQRWRDHPNFEQAIRKTALPLSFDSRRVRYAAVAAAAEVVIKEKLRRQSTPRSASLGAVSARCFVGQCMCKSLAPTTSSLAIAFPHSW